jgi:hypothetical protein
MFKKLTYIIAVLPVIMLSTMSFAAAPSSIDGKIGAGYALDPGKWGLEMDLLYLKDLDPYFGIGIDPGFYWLNWQQKLGDITTDSGVNASEVKETDAFMVPVFATAQLRMVFLQEMIGIEPYLNIGLGYSAMFLSYSNAKNKSKVDYYGGFSWQLVAGTVYTPKGATKIKFLVEAGYRSADVKHGNNISIDMSGLIFNVGVRYPLGI